ncbi:MAG: glycosyltransferase family 4 protein [Phycisphaerae bacterium]|nr:glycosyltransferase family 4 protein [Phycisphaerae bacterium]
MHILFLSHYFPPEGNAPASRVHDTCKRWVQKGHKVTVITCAPNCPNGIVYEGYKNKFFQRETVDDINVIRVWTKIAANRGTVRRMLNYISYMFSAVFIGLFVKKPDILIATSPQFFCGWAGTLLSKLRRLPFILEIRDIWPDSIVAVDAITNHRVIHILETLEYLMYKSADKIVTVGAGYKRQLIQKGVPGEKIDIITNGVDPDIYFPREPDMALKKRYDLENKFICSYIGTIGMASGLHVAVEAAQILKNRNRDDIRLLIVGDGAIRRDLQKQAQMLNLDNIVFTGQQPKKKIPNFLSIADLCLVHLKKASLFKSVLPSKIFETAAMGKPMVIGVQGDAADLVTDAGAGVCIEPENADQLAAALEKLADRPGQLQTMGRAGQNYILNHYNRQTLAADYLQIIHQTVGDDSNPAPETIHLAIPTLPTQFAFAQPHYNSPILSQRTIKLYPHNIKTAESPTSKLKSSSTSHPTSRLQA